ncbi:phosphonopyruvate decarboxylase [Helicobacter colisuis]|uniref:Phosphonopyruvate decarboxylase n=1 Tax=Helicobacter colisuis TaxID=2949739 RepID=A0ABT0TTG8_9HELI|nr:phosphonopyruvate decarboxylase [Helicobacter colisuis]MCL9819159.1 phosphonopyruvate decarboxylase [Helicobacter colisuis]
MLDALEFARFLKEYIGIYAGVPDSSLKSLNLALREVMEDDNFYTTANEGQAIAFAGAYHLATSKVGVVYMQNSGLGNAINPLLSFVDKKVYQIPLIMLIGMRGGENDEPQHRKQGFVTKSILEVCEIPYIVLSRDMENAKKQFVEVFDNVKRNLSIIAILIERDAFNPFQLTHKIRENKFSLKREKAISIVQDYFLEAKFIGSTGMISRELYDLREYKKMRHSNDFLVVGSMGFASSIAYILSKYSSNQIVCLDGDGSFLMHMGCLSNFKGVAFVHIVLNNFAHDSVGGQETNANNIDFLKIAKGCGYQKAYKVSTEKELKELLANINYLRELIFIEIDVAKGARKDLGRPKNVIKLKEEFCREF